MNSNNAFSTEENPTLWNEKYLKEADRIGKRLCRDAVWDDGRCNWLSENLDPIDGLFTNTFRAVDSSLYSGTAGIALFLQYLYQYNKDPILHKTLIGASHHLLNTYHSLDDIVRIGYLNGALGIIDCLIKIADAINEPSLKTKALNLLDDYCKLEPNSLVMDLLGGSAGAIIFLLKVAKQENNELYQSCAIKHGDFLLEQAIKTEKGWSWPMKTMAIPTALTGYSHGAAGYSQALLELAVFTNEPKYRQAALLAVQWEDSVFNHEVKNWPDLREHDVNSSHPPHCMSAWCHGAPGIALSRFALTRAIPNNLMLINDLNTAVSSTINEINQSAHLPTSNFSLCHGLCGNADILLSIGHYLKRDELVDAAYRIGQIGLERIENNDAPWPCGLQGVGEIPSLMMGTAGIGLFYLRLYDPKRIESPLINSSIPLDTTIAIDSSIPLDKGE